MDPNTATATAPATANSAGFCATCAAASSDRSPGNISTVNGIGRQFYGSASPCGECESVVRTLWWTLVDVPIIPLGSYRYRAVGGPPKSWFAKWVSPPPRFWARRCPTDWQQVMQTWAIGLTLGVVVFGGIIVWMKMTGKL